MKLTKKLTSRILEAAIFAEGKPISAEKLRKILPRDQRPPLGEIRGILEDLTKHYQNRGVQLVEVASGYRFQVAEDVSEHLVEQQEEKPMRMSKAFMETLALVAYRQPITRGEIEDIRGVAVSSNIIRSLLELEWIREVGHKDVPGKPALFATTKKFLDFFNLKALGELPPLAQLQELSETRMQEEFEQLNLQLEQSMTDEEQQRDQAKRAALLATLSPEFIGPLQPGHKEAVEQELMQAEEEDDAPSVLDEPLPEAGELTLTDEQDELEDTEDAIMMEGELDEQAQSNSKQLEQAGESETDFEAEFEAEFESEFETEAKIHTDPETEFAPEAEAEAEQAILSDEIDEQVDFSEEEFSEDEFSESSASVIDLALRKMREDMNSQKVDSLSSIQSEEADETQLFVEQTPKNHKPLEGFTDIVMTSKDPNDEDDEVAGEDV